MSNADASPLSGTRAGRAGAFASVPAVPEAPVGRVVTTAPPPRPTVSAEPAVTSPPPAPAPTPERESGGSVVELRERRPAAVDPERRDAKVSCYLSNELYTKVDALRSKRRKTWGYFLIEAARHHWQTIRDQVSEERSDVPLADDLDANDPFPAPSSGARLQDNKAVVRQDVWLSHREKAAFNAVATQIGLSNSDFARRCLTAEVAAG